MKPADYRT